MLFKRSQALRAQFNSWAQAMGLTFAAGSVRDMVCKSSYLLSCCERAGK